MANDQTKTPKTAVGVFKEFVKECVLSDNALLTDGESLFTENNLEETRKFLKEIKKFFDEHNVKAREENKTNKSSQKIWGIGDIFDGGVFDKLEVYTDEDKKKAIIKILLHCNWLMYFCSDRQHKQKTVDGYYKSDIDKYFKVQAEWAIGPTFSGTSLDAMLFIVDLVLQIKKCNMNDKNVDSLVNEIKNLCNGNESNWQNDELREEVKTISSNAIVNILLFLCDTKQYLPIPAQDKKRLIAEKLGSIIQNSATDEDINKKLYNIRNIINGILHTQELNPFWLPNIRPFWDESTPNLNSDNLPEETLLEYKKSMVLYGPPGTSKSYQARRIAEIIIAKKLRENNQDIKKCIEELENILNSHIHVLQMHPNYTYDDFIVGKSIENNKVVVKPGKLLKIIAGITKTDMLPHFIILDEINRVDISRVFGELFTAMEPSYREKGVELNIDVSQISEDDKKGLSIDENKLFLKVPENMYFIGTMNMIDFSLEQVDFALRRRFLWRLSTYDDKRLCEIISEKVKERLSSKKDDDEAKEWYNRPDDYIKSCTALNNQIEWEPSLGKDYVIGHTFFAEIVDIFGKVKDWTKARNILWQISILPTLEAYCGTIDANVKDEFIKNCKKSFMPDTKTSK